MQIMRNANLAVIRRAQDLACITALETGSVSLGAVGTMNQTVAQRIGTILRNANVGEDDNGNLFCLLSIAAYMYMTDITSFAHADYVNFSGAAIPSMEGIPEFGRWKHWMGINWAGHAGVTGNGTTSTCLAYHRAAAGYAMSTAGLDAQVGYDAKQQTSWTRASIFHGAVKLQNAGIIKFTHTDTGLSA